MNDELIKAVKGLLSDIEGMQTLNQEGEKSPNWFGGFGESYEVWGGVAIEWPNLAISAMAVKELLDGPVVAGSLAAPQLSINNASSEDTQADLISKGLAPRFKVGDYVTGYAPGFGTVSGEIIKVDLEDRNQFYRIMHNDWPVWLENHTVELAAKPEDAT